jgi:hypothetical protein
MFWSMTIIRELHMSPAEVTLRLKQSVKLRHYVLCGGVAACYAATPQTLISRCMVQ